MTISIWRTNFYVYYFRIYKYEVILLGYFQFFSFSFNAVDHFSGFIKRFVTNVSPFELSRGICLNSSFICTSYNWPKWRNTNRHIGVLCGQNAKIFDLWFIGHLKTLLTLLCCFDIIWFAVIPGWIFSQLEPLCTAGLTRCSLKVTVGSKWNIHDEIDMLNLGLLTVRWLANHAKRLFYV